MTKNITVKVKSNGTNILTINISSPVELEISVSGVENAPTPVEPVKIEEKVVKTPAPQEELKEERMEETQQGESPVPDEELFKDAVEGSSAPVEETSEKPPANDVLTDFFNETDKQAVILQKTVEEKSKESVEKERKAKEIVNELLGL